MPRAEPLNEKIIQALQSRKRRAELLGQQKQFQYVRAIQLITEFRGNITRLSQITSLCRPNKITKAIFNEIEDVLTGKSEVEVPEPSPAQQARGQARGPVQQRLPGVETGAGAILLVLYRESQKPNGSQTMTKDQIMSRATNELNVNMYDESAGFSRWSGIKSLEDKHWVKREAFSRRFGGGGSGRFGGAKDQFWITDEGKAAAARLETQHRGQTGGLAALSPIAAAAAAGGGGTPCRAAAATGNSSRFAAAGYAGRAGDDHHAHYDDDDDDDDPFAALLGGFLQGPEFTGNPAAAAGRYQPGEPLAAANMSPFSGRGHVLGQGSSHHLASGAAAETSRGAAFNPADYLDDDEDLDADGFQIYRQEWFENHQLSPPPPPPASRQPPAAATHEQSAAAAAAEGQTAIRLPAATAATAAAAAAASSRGLIPKTRKRDKREPLCDKDSGCTPCRSLRGFLSESTSSTLLMTLTKTKQQHVQQRVAYLVSLEGGQWPLSVTVENDNSLIVRKQAQSGSSAQTPAAAAAKLDPLAELSKMLGMSKQQQQQQQQQQQHKPPQQQPAQQTQSPAPQPSTVTAAIAMHEDFKHHQHSFQQRQSQLTPAQMAAAAAEARVKQQQQQQQQQQQHQREPLPERHLRAAAAAAAAAEPIILDSQLDDVAVDLHTSAPQLVDLALLESQDVLDATCTAAAAAAVERFSPRKRHRQQVLHTSLAVDGVDGLDDNYDDNYDDASDVVVHQYAAAASPAPGRKKQRREQQQQQQQQRPIAAGECISLLESQDVDFELPDSDLDLEQPTATAIAAAAAAHRTAVSGSRQTAAVAAAGQNVDNLVQQRSAAGAATDRAADRHAGIIAHSNCNSTSRSPTSSRCIEVKLVVDDKERRSDSAPNQVYQYIRQDCKRLLEPGLPYNITVDIDRDMLPLGDYAWLLLDTGDSSNHRRHQHTAAAAAAAAAGVGADIDDVDDEAAAAEERAGCVVAGAVVERKTIRDIVSRSAGGDHIRQLQRMNYFCDLLPYQLLVIENLTQMAQNYIVFSSNKGSSQTHTAIYDEASLFDFTVRVMVSEYGSVQKILLAPSTGDTRSILLAVTQLLIHDLLQQQQQQHTENQQQVQILYSEFQRQVNQVNRRLPRSDIPDELADPTVAEVVPPDLAFRVTNGQGEYAGLKLYTHKTYKGGNHLQIVYVQGRKLLMLVDGFYKQITAEQSGYHDAAAAAAAAGAGTSSSSQQQHTVVQAVDIALELVVLLASYLDAFVSKAAAATVAVAHAAGDSCSCRVLLVENLFGPSGAVTYMSTAQQAAAVAGGSKPASKQAAERQAEMCALDGAAIKQYIWLWMVCFALKQGWHVQLCQSANSVGWFLQAAGSRCCYLAQQQQGQQGAFILDLEQQQQLAHRLEEQEKSPMPQQMQDAVLEQQQPELVVADSEGEEELDVSPLLSAVPRASAGARRTPGDDISAAAKRTEHWCSGVKSRGFAAWLEQETAPTQVVDVAGQRIGRRASVQECQAARNSVQDVVVID